MRIILKFQKLDELKYISHLDMQRAFHRAIKRARLPIAYSQGFNPHQRTSFASALSLGNTSLGEWMDLYLEDGAQLSPKDVKDRLNAEFPKGFNIVKAVKAPEGYPSLTVAMHGAVYKARPIRALDLEPDEISTALTQFLSEPIMVEKKKKSGGKHEIVLTDIRPMVEDMSVCEDSDGFFINIKGRLDASGGLNVSSLLDAFSKSSGIDALWSIERTEVILDPEP